MSMITMMFHAGSLMNIAEAEKKTFDIKQNKVSLGPFTFCTIFSNFLPSLAPFEEEFDDGNN